MTSCDVSSIKRTIQAKLQELTSSYSLASESVTDENLIKAEQDLNAWVKEYCVKDGYLDKYKLNALENFLKNQNLPLNLEIPDLPIRKQLHSKFTHMSKDNAIQFFGGNTAITLYIKQRLTADTIKHSIIDRSKNAKIHIFRTPKQLNVGIQDFKNQLCQNLVNALKLNSEFGEGFQFFTELGCNLDAYDSLMEKAANAYGNLIPANTEFSPQSQDSFALYSLYVLNNFDALLADELKGIISEGDLHEGELDRVNYIVGDFDGDEDVHYSQDLMWENATSHISSLAKKIISAVPKVIINNKKIQTLPDSYLSVNDLFQVSYYVQNALANYNLAHLSEPLDLFKDPVGAVKTLLELVYKGTTEPVSSKLSIEEQNIKKYQKNLANSFEHARNTALSLYTFLFNSPTKDLDNGELDVSTIENEEIVKYGFIKGGIVNAIVWEILKNNAPTYLQYDINGLLIDPKNGKTDKKILNYAKQTTNTHKLGNAVKHLLTLLAFEPSDGKLHTALKEVTEGVNTTGSGILPKLKTCNGTFSDFKRKSDSFTFLLNTLIGNGFNWDINDSFDGIFKTAKHIDSTNSIKMVQALQLLFACIKNQAVSLSDGTKLESAFDSIKDTLRSDTIDIFNFLSENLAPLFGVFPITVVKDITQASIPVYRQYSLAFGDQHHILSYKPENKIEQNLKKDIGTQYPGAIYVPMRKRCNFFVDHPGILTNVGNSIYGGDTAIRLASGDESTNEESRKLDVLGQFIQGFVGDFVSLLGAHDTNGMEAPMTATTFGVLSDKTTIITKMLNGNYRYGNQSWKKFILKGPDEIAKLDRYYRFNTQLDLVDHILTTWKLIFDEYNKSSEGKKSPIVFNYKLFEFNGKQYKFSKIYKTLRSGIFRTNNSEQQLKILQSCYLEEIEAINSLNEIFQGDLFKTDFVEKVVPTIASNLGLEFMPELFGSQYKTGFKFNKSIQQDLITLSNEQSWLDYQESKFQKMLNFQVIYKGNNMSLENALQNIFRKDFGRNPDFIKALEYSGLKIYDVRKELDVVKLRNALKTYLVYTNFIRHQYLDLTNKEAYLDPNKGGSEDLDVEIHTRLVATNKRNVAVGGTISPFLMNTISGVSNKTKAAIIQDYNEQVFNALGQTAKQVIYDGAAFISPIQARMEGESLGGTKHFNTIKTLGSWIKDYSTSLAKWAEHAITNSMIRNSKNGKFDFEDIFQMMHSIPFPENTNICSAFWKSKPSPIVAMSELNGGNNFYFTDGLYYYQLLTVEFLGNNQYKRKYIQVDSRGNYHTDKNGKLIPIEDTVSINSLYQAYKAFGGYNSMELKEGRLRFSENVMDVLYNITVRVGSVNQEAFAQKNIYDQSTVIQPLRDSFIGILATESSIKRGQINMNLKNAYTPRDVSDFKIKTKLNWFYVDLSQTGLQLDAYHSAEGAEATETTQALATQLENGFNTEDAFDIYNSIASIIEANSSELQNRYEALKQGKWEEMLKKISQEILKENSNLTTNEIQAIITKYLKKTLQQSGKESVDDIQLPVKHFANSIAKVLTKDLNKNAIRRKNKNSIAAVMKPTSNALQVYTFNGKSYLREDITKALLRDRTINKNLLKRFLDTMSHESGEEGTRLLKDMCLFTIGAELLVDPEAFNTVKSFVISSNKINTNGGEDLIDAQVLKYMYLNSTNPKEFEAYQTYLQETGEESSNKFLLMESITPGKVQPLDTVISNENSVTLSTLEEYRNISKKHQNDSYILIDRSKPADLKPQIRQIESESRTQNQYNSLSCGMGMLLHKMQSMAKNDEQHDALKELGESMNKSCNI